MVTRPMVEQRPSQPYAGIQAHVTMEELARTLPPLWPQVFTWRREHGVAPAGTPFVRYLVADTERELEVEAAVPVATAARGDDRVATGVVPAGRYAVVVHTGPREELPGAHAALQRWGTENGVRWRMDGARWAGRVESSLTELAGEDPDPDRRQTEVRYLVAGERAA